MRWQWCGRTGDYPFLCEDGTRQSKAVPEKAGVSLCARADRAGDGSACGFIGLARRWIALDRHQFRSLASGEGGFLCVCALSCLDLSSLLCYKSPEVTERVFQCI